MGWESKIIEEKKLGSAEWSGRRVRLVECIERKTKEEFFREWDAKFKRFLNSDGMPAVGTDLYLTGNKLR